MDRGSNTDKGKPAREQKRCFVCDAEVMGRFYSLATCRTQNSQTRVIEKLGELVGEGYMVVISEDDVICRSCGILVNTFDRLEVEMGKARDHILHFLEQKYSLKDGELRSIDKPKPCQPPQITRSMLKEIAPCSTKSSSNENDVNPGDKSVLASNTNSYSWLQCDRCKYTMHLNSFMVHHFRDHINKRSYCDNCGHILTPQIRKHNCNQACDDLGNKENETDNSGIVMKDEMEITLPDQNQTILPITRTTPPPLVALSNYDHQYASNTLLTSYSMSSQESICAPKSINMVDINSGEATRSNSNPAQEAIVKDTSKGRKHMLTLKEDGSLEMVEIPYDEAANIDPLMLP